MKFFSLFLLSIAGAAALALAGCASAPPPALPAVRAELQRRLGADAPLPSDEAGRPDAIRELLRDPLDPDAAVRIAVLNNRGLRATFEDLGISQADLVAAGLLRNPSLSAEIRWPRGAPRGPDVDLALAAGVFDDLFIPLRKRVAGERLAQAEERVGQAVLDLAAEVKAAVYTVEAAGEFSRRMDLGAQAGGAAADLARRQYDAGDINELELDTRRISAEEAQAEAMRAHAALTADREDVDRLLGLASADLGWTAGSLEPLPEKKPVFPDLAGRAADRRLDLAAARHEVIVARTALDLKRKTRLLPASASVGVDTERYSDGSRVTGPTFQVGLPIFDQGQADVARLEAGLRQAQARLESLQASIESEVRAAADAADASWSLADYYGRTLLPHHEELLRQTLLQYNAMQKSGYDLLAAKHAEIAAQREAIEQIRDYWIAQARLERAAGGRLDDAPATPTLTQP